jgi:hypothetical protein
MTNNVLVATNLSENATNAIGKFSNTAGNVPPTQWMIIAGCVFGGLTLLFLMYLVLRDKPVEDRKFLIISIIAFGLALTGGFLGSSGTLSGSLPLPESLQNPLTFGITGGAAVFLVAWLIGYWLYARTAPLPAPEISINYPAGTKLADAIRLAAKRNQGGECSVNFSPNEQPFREPIVAVGQLTAKTATELVNMLQNHLAQGTIKYTTTKPDNQNLITVNYTGN